MSLGALVDGKGAMVVKDAYRSRLTSGPKKNRLAETPLSSRPEAARKRGYCFGMRIVGLSSTGADAEIRPEIFIFYLPFHGIHLSSVLSHTPSLFQEWRSQRKNTIMSKRV
jgi:hypothetical protein